MKILICGLPGSGKTTLAKCLYEKLWNSGELAAWFNADEIRAYHDDWDFSEQGRLRQADRMQKLCEDSNVVFNICDFVAPTEATRKAFDADFTVWVDTISASRYEDTNIIFEIPEHVDIRVPTKDANQWAGVIYERLFN